MKLIFDSSSLITASKFYVDQRLVMDYILRCFQVVVPEEVKRETVDMGLARGYADAFEIEKGIANGLISVIPVSPLESVFEEVLEDYDLETGDREVLRLCRQTSDYDYVVVDDHILFIIAHRLGIEVLFLPDVICDMVKRNMLDPQKASEMLSEIRSRYRRGFIEHTLKKIQGVI